MNSLTLLVKSSGVSQYNDLIPKLSDNCVNDGFELYSVAVILFSKNNSSKYIPFLAYYYLK